MIGVWWLRSQLTLKNLLLSMSGKSFETGYAFSLFVIGWFQAFSLNSGHSGHGCCVFQGAINGLSGALITPDTVGVKSYWIQIHVDAKPLL